MSRIAIIGPGAVGGTVAGLLAAAGRHEVVLCSRQPLESLSVETPKGVLESRPAVFTDPSKVGPVDWVFVTTKCYDSDGAGAWLKALCSKGAPAAILQNGIGRGEPFSRRLPREKILHTLVYCPAERTGPGKIVLRGICRLVVHDIPLGRDLAAIFTGCDIAVEMVADFLSAEWTKLCANAPGILDTILLQPARIYHDPQIAPVVLDLVRECAAVGRAEGATLPEDIADRVLDRHRRGSPDSINSMLADRMAGRPLELEERNGIIVRLGEKHGIPTPCNRTAVAILAALARR